MIPKKYVFLSVLGILLIATFLRFHELPSYPPGLYPDEAMNGNNALEAVRGESEGFRIFYPENNGREGLFINIQGLFLKKFLEVFALPQPWMLRVPSALFGIFTVLGVFLLGRGLARIKGEGERAAFVIGAASAFLVATSFWHINFSRVGFRAIMAPFFLTWGMYLLIFSVEKMKELKASSLKLKATLLFLLAGATYGLGMHSYIAYRATPLLVLLVFWWLGKNHGWKRAVKALTCFAAGALIVSLPLIAYFTTHPEDFFGRTTQLSVFSSSAPLKDLAWNTMKTVQMFFFVGDGNARHNLPYAPQLFPIVGFFFAVALVEGASRLVSRRGKNLVFLFLVSWLAITALPVVISNEGIPHALRAIIMIPAAYLLAGFGIWSAWKLLIRRIDARVIFTFFSLLFLITFFNAYYSYFFLWGENKDTRNAFSAPYVETANFVNALPKSIPKYIIVDAGGVDVRGVPMPAQTVMFLTDSFSNKQREEKNITYVLPFSETPIPADAAIFVVR